MNFTFQAPSVHPNRDRPHRYANNGGHGNNHSFTSSRTGTSRMSRSLSRVKEPYNPMAYSTENLFE